MKRLAPVAAILLLVLAALGGRATADPPIGAVYGQFTANAQSFVARCSGGQSTAVVSVDNSGTLVGTVTVSTAAQDANANPILPYGTPLSSTPPGSSTQTTTITSYPGKLYVVLGSDGFVQAATTAYSSGTANMSIVCTGAVARAPSGGSSPAPTVCPSAGQNIMISGTYPCTVAETNTAQPQATPSAGASAVPTAGAPSVPQTGAWPYVNALNWYQQPIVYVTTANSSTATGTTANTYQTISSVSGTTPAFSPGVNGNWLLTVHSDVFVSALVANGVYACVTLTGSPTTIDTTRGNGASNCVTTLTNSIMGTTLFGVLSSTLMVSMTAHVTLPVNTAYTMTLVAAGPGTVSYTVFGYAGAKLDYH